MVSESLFMEDLEQDVNEGESEIIDRPVCVHEDGRRSGSEGWEDFPVAIRRILTQPLKKDWPTEHQERHQRKEITHTRLIKPRRKLDILLVRVDETIVAVVDDLV